MAMLSKEMKEILATSRAAGWVLEPRAKELLAAAGIPVPRFTWAHDMEEATRFANTIGYPVVAKVVSPAILHKSDAGGVSVGIKDDSGLRAAYKRFEALEGFAGVLVEEMVDGLELIVGAKVDYQFGPVILLGIGGTSVEIYNDTRIRMAPLAPAAGRLSGDRPDQHPGLNGHADGLLRLSYGKRGRDRIDRSQPRQVLCRAMYRGGREDHACNRGQHRRKKVSIDEEEPIW
jgi:hypothetical protein